MGIYDRDYMRRPKDRGTRYPGESGESQGGGWLGRVFEKYPRIGLWLAAVLAVLLLAAVIFSKISM